MDHDKEVNAHKASVDFLNLATTALNDTLLRNFLRALHHIDEFHVIIDSVALFEDNRPQSHVSLIEPTGRNLQVGISSIFFGLFLLVLFALASGKAGVGLTYVLVFVFGQQGEVVRWDYLAKDAFAPCFPSFAFVIDLQVL